VHILSRLAKWVMSRRYYKGHVLELADVDDESEDAMHRASVVGVPSPALRANPGPRGNLSSWTPAGEVYVIESTPAVPPRNSS